MGKYNQGMQMLARVLIASAPAMYIMMFFVMMGMILFGSLVFAFEQGTWKVSPVCPPNGGGFEDPRLDGACYLRKDYYGIEWEPSPFAKFGIPGAFWWVQFFSSAYTDVHASISKVNRLRAFAWLRVCHSMRLSSLRA